MRVVIYIRTARDDAGRAVDHQRAALHRLAAERRWQPVGEYIDVGQPGGAALPGTLRPGSMD